MARIASPARGRRARSRDRGRRAGGALARASRRPPVWARALLGYAGLALLLTWPLALHLGDRFPGQQQVDAWLHYWNIWWFKTALLHGQSPYRTDLLFAPDGAGLFLHTLAPFNDLLALGPALLAGPLVAYNLLVLMTIAFAGQAAFLLARALTGRAGPAFVGGVAVAASPYLMGHLAWGDPNVAALGWLPLVALGLLGAAAGRRRHVLLAALAVPMTALCEWHTTLAAGLVALVLIAARLLAAPATRAAWAAAGRMTAALALGGLLTLPLAVATAREAAEAGAAAALGPRQAAGNSANLLAYPLPQDLHPLWGAAVARWRATHLTESLGEGRVSLGGAVLALAALGVVGRRGRALPWLAIGGLGVALALGPMVHVGRWVGEATTPYELLARLPYLQVARTPARFSALAVLALAVLAAFGAGWLADRLARRVAPALTVTVAGLLVAGEFLTAPFPLGPPPDTAVARQVGRAVAAADPAGRVLTLPYREAEKERLFHQVQHERPIFGGFLPRDRERLFRTTAPGFAELGRAAPAVDMFAPAPDPLAVLNYYRVRYVLVYAGEMDAGWRRRLAATLRRVLRQPGPALTAADATLEAWWVPPAAPPGPFLRADAGWRPVEELPGLGPARWMGERATLVLERPERAALTLRFTAVSLAMPRRVAVLADGAPVGAVTVGTGPTEVAVALPAGAGATRLTLHSLDGADTPSALGLPDDRRRLSVALAQVELLSRPDP